MGSVDPPVSIIILATPVILVTLSLHTLFATSAHAEYTTVNESSTVLEFPPVVIYV